jgi:hypothetical protein
MNVKKVYVIQAWDSEEELWLDCEDALYAANKKNLEKIIEKFESWKGTVEGFELRIIEREEKVLFTEDDKT